MPHSAPHPTMDGFWPTLPPLLRAVRIAADPRKLTLAALALVVLWAGDWAIYRLPFAPAVDPSVDAASVPPAPWDAARPALLTGWGGPATTVFDAPRDWFSTLGRRLLSPLDPLLGVVLLPFAGGGGWAGVAFAWTRWFWAAAVWSLLGGAIARIAAVEFARDERPSLAASLKFSLTRWTSFFSAPLLPLCGVLFFWTLLALGGLFGRVPAVGPWLAAFCWGLAALAALLLVLIAAATAAGWPLMIAGVAAEGSDAFDGFSRSFSYIYGRPWRAFAYGVAALAIGLLAVAAADTLAVGLTVAAARTVATGMGTEEVAALHAAPPGYFAGVGLFPFDGTPSAGAAAAIAGFWLRIIATVAVGFAASYFWSAAVAVYFLLRRSDDGTHLDEVWLGEPSDADDLLPLAGIAAGGQPVTERPHEPAAAPPESANSAD